MMTKARILVLLCCCFFIIIAAYFLHPILTSQPTIADQEAILTLSPDQLEAAYLHYQQLLEQSQQELAAELRAYYLGQGTAEQVYELLASVEQYRTRLAEIGQALIELAAAASPGW